MTRLQVTRDQPSTSTEKIRLNCNDTTAGGSIIMPIDINTEATTRSMIRKGRNSRKPISKARFNSEIMKAGTRIRSDMSSGVAGGASPDRSMNSFRSFSRTFFCMKPHSGALQRVLDADLVGDQRLDAVVVGFLQHRAHYERG